MGSKKNCKRENCKKSIGIDISKKMIIQAKKKKDSKRRILFIQILNLGSIEENLILFFQWSHYIMQIP